MILVPSILLLARRNAGTLLALALSVCLFGQETRPDWVTQIQRKPFVDVRTYGAKCDGVTDDAPSIRAALASGSNVFLPMCTTPYLVNSYAGTYSNNSWVFMPTNSNQRVYSDGPATIMVANGLLNTGGQEFGGGVWLLQNLTNYQVSNLVIDMNGANNLVPSGVIRNGIAIKVVGSTRVAIDHNEILEDPGQNAFAADSTSAYVTVNNNLVYDGGTALAGNTNQVDWSAMYSEAPHTTFDTNTIVDGVTGYPRGPSGGIELHGSYSSAVNNNISRAFPCFYINPPVASETQTEVRISQNRCINGFSGVILTSGYINDASITENVFELTPNLWPSNVLTTFPSEGIEQYNLAPTASIAFVSNLNITDNIFREIETSPPAIGSTGINLSTLNNAVIANNQILNMAAGGMILGGNGYGLNNVTVEGNNFVDYGASSPPTARYGLLLYLLGTNSDCIAICTTYNDLSNVSLLNNAFSQDSPSTGYGAFDLNWDLANSQINGLNISGNTFHNVIPKIGNASNGAYGPAIAGYAQSQWD